MQMERVSEVPVCYNSYNCDRSRAGICGVGARENCSSHYGF
jgi:hypothetical protein